MSGNGKKSEIQLRNYERQDIAGERKKNMGFRRKMEEEKKEGQEGKWKT